MRVRSIVLEDIRSYGHADMALDPHITALVGPNGAGKTNVLESVHLLARGDSPRAHDDGELVRWGAVMGRASAETERAGAQRRVEVVLFSPAPGERRRQRRYLLDGAPKRADEALGEIVVVAFFPEDVDLMAEAPSRRRRYMDAMIAQVERRHRAEARDYQRVLEQRNALLRALREEEDRSREGELAFWDGELCRLAAALSLRRLRAVRELSGPFHRTARLWGGDGGVEVAYATPAEGETEAEREASYRRLLTEKRDKELWQGVTLVGPHREDLAVTASGRELPSFASRGEQRSVVLALKLAEAEWLTERTGTAPVFLLDDVLSELDAERRQLLIDAIPEGAQVLLTSALPAGLPQALRERATVVPVTRGRVG